MDINISHYKEPKVRFGNASKNHSKNIQKIRPHVLHDDEKKIRETRTNKSFGIQHMHAININR